MILCGVCLARFRRRRRALESLPQTTHSLRNHSLNIEWQAGKHTFNEYQSFYCVWWKIRESGYEFLDGNEAVNPTQGPVLLHYRDTCLGDIQNQNEIVWNELVTKKFRFQLHTFDCVTEMGDIVAAISTMEPLWSCNTCHHKTS